MDTKEMKFDNASVRADRFHFLPDELLLFMFNKITDLKTLFHCSLVSKRIASVIYRIRAISVTLPRNEAYYLDSHQCELTLSREINQLISDETPGFFKQSLHKLKLPILIDKFLELESVYLEYTCPRNKDNSMLPKWKVNYGCSTSISGSFITMLPVSVHKKSEFVPDQEPLTMENSADFVISRINDCFLLSFWCYKEWLLLTDMLFKCRSTLKCVTVTDSGKNAKLVTTDEQFCMMRSHLLNKKGEVPNYQTSFAWVPELHLPLSGYVMKGVGLVILKGPNEGEVDDVIGWDFDEEEKVFGEAIKEILKNHRDKFLTRR